MTTPLPDWSEDVAAMIRIVSGSEPLFALFGEQRFGTIILGLAQHSDSERLVLIAADTDDDMVTITLERATVRQFADALNGWLS